MIFTPEQEERLTEIVAQMIAKHEEEKRLSLLQRLEKQHAQSLIEQERSWAEIQQNKKVFPAPDDPRYQNALEIMKQSEQWGGSSEQPQAIARAILNALAFLPPSAADPLPHAE